MRSTGGGKTGEVMAEIRICLGWELGINVQDRKKGYFFFIAWTWNIIEMEEAKKTVRFTA